MVFKISESISMVLPVYNEEALLEETVKSALLKLSRFSDTYEIVIVDDAGSDRTGVIADKLAAEYPQITVLHNIVNMSVGISVLRGLKVAKGDIIFHNSADCPFDIDDLALALPLLKDADVAVAVRIDRSAHSVWRKMTSLGNRTLIKLLFMPGIDDMNFIQVYRRKVLNDPDVINLISRSPAFVTPELLIRARKRGYRIAQFNAVFHRRKAGKASFGRPHDILWTFYDMLRFRIRSRK
ncbi:MAG: glycosyltransferase family 2 protein [Nitrospirae bacterium]|nr:glycosyltransferase family 2 protein [Nitrospirota bacterium]